MKKSIILFFIFSLFTNTVWSFDIDTSIGVAYQLNPNSNLNYDQTKLKGVQKDELELKKYSDLVIGEARKNNYAEYLAVPPGTDVYFYLFTKNNTEVNQTIFNIDLYLSRSNLLSGDLTRLGAEGDIKTITYQIAGIPKARSGYTKTFNVDLLLEPGSDNNAYPLYSFSVITPLKLGNLKYTPIYENSQLKLEYSVEVENISKYTLCDLYIQEFQTTFCLEPNEKSIQTYISDITQEDTLTQITLVDPNRHFEATTSQLLSVQDSNPEGNPAVVSSTVGVWPAKGEELKNLTIELLPYKLFSEPIVVELKRSIESDVSVEWKNKDNGLFTVSANLINSGDVMFNSYALVQYGDQIQRFELANFEPSSTKLVTFTFKYQGNQNLNIKVISNQSEIEIWNNPINLSKEISIHKDAKIDIENSTVAPKVVQTTVKGDLKKRIDSTIIKLKDVEGVMESKNISKPLKSDNFSVLKYIFIGILLAVLVWIFVRLW